MEIPTIKIEMFEMMAIVVLVIYFGQWIREKAPVLKKYCIPSAVVGGTIFAIVTCALYMGHIVQFEWENQSIMNNFFYNIFFAASGIQMLPRTSSGLLSLSLEYGRSGNRASPSAR